MRTFIASIGPVRLCAALCLLVSTALSAWTGDSNLNTVISAATGDQLYQVAAGDGAGGVIVAWEDRRSGGSDIYAQRADAAGRVLWAADGVQLHSGDGHDTVIAGDGSSGAYLAWESYADGEIYVQRIGSDGAVATGWPAGGLTLTSGIESNAHPVVITDGAGGVLVAWRHFDAVTGSDIYLQRVDADGSVHAGWPAGGAVVTAASDGQYQAALVGDGAGGAFVVWQSFIGGDDKIYAQRFDGDGAVHIGWAAGGVALATSTGSQTYPAVVGDGSGGVIVVWEDWRAAMDYGDLYGQRIDAGGSLLWDAAGVALAAVAGSYQDDFRLLGDASGGAYLAWRDTRNAELWPLSPTRSDVYVHRVDGDGAAVAGWPVNGVRLTAAGHRAGSPYLTSDGGTGAVVGWDDNVYPTTAILAQRVSVAGAVQWTAGGVTVSDQPGYAIEPVAVADGDGGALVAWRNRLVQGNFEIFAQRVYGDGTLTSLATPLAVSPVDGAVVDAAPRLDALAFSDGAAPAVGQSQAQWRVLGYADAAPERPKTAADMGSMSDGALDYRLPFSFPFYGRAIVAIAVNRNGLVELLEEGESCVQCTAAGTHASDAHLDAMDAIFASNGELYAEDGYVKIFNGGDHVMVEWYGATSADGGGAMALVVAMGPGGGSAAPSPVHFQVLLHRSGQIVWNFRQMDFTAYDYDMYSGVYPNGGSAVDVGYAINTQSSHTFNPATQTVAAAAYRWDDPAAYVLHDSGASATDLAGHDVPTAAGLAAGQDYYWAVRYQSDIGDWTAWSSPAAFSVAGAAAPASGGGGAFGPLLGVLLGLPWLRRRRHGRRAA